MLRHRALCAVAHSSSDAGRIIRRTVGSWPSSNTGLYDPKQERDNCGVGLVAKLNREQR